jgi:hypothetical protein
MSLINQPISAQKFELIRDQIAIILATEIDNQGILTYDPRLLGMKVFVESVNAEDKTDLALVNVSFVKGFYGDLKVGNGATKGNYIYHIDVYTNSKQTDAARGDKLSALSLQRILGVCRTILDHPVYKTLAFSPGFIYRVNCREINIRDEGKNDGLNSRMGRLSFEVQAEESNIIPEGLLLVESNTTVNLNGSQKGYYWSVSLGDFVLEDFNDDFNV